MSAEEQQQLSMAGARWQQTTGWQICSLGLNSAAARIMQRQRRKRAHTSSAVGQKGETPAAARPAASVAAAARDGGTASSPGEDTSSSASWTASPATCAGAGESRARMLQTLCQTLGHRAEPRMWQQDGDLRAWNA